LTNLNRLANPTSWDVAAEAKVSQSTVSRALRGHPGISLETRDRISRAAVKLGYRPDVRAVRLRGGPVGCIAVVMLYAAGASRQSLNSFYFEIAAAVEAAAAKRGHTVILSLQSDAASLRSDYQQRREADGMIVIGTAMNGPAWDQFARAHADGANLVTWGAPDDTLPCVRADNVAAGRLAVKHLAQIGRRHIAFVGPGWPSHLSFEHRRQGYLEAVRAMGLEPIEMDLPASGDRVLQGEQFVSHLCHRGVRFDAVFAASDALAAGVISGLSQAGLSIPSDVAVVGFDGGQGATLCNPRLTTVEQDVTLAGDLLVEGLLSKRQPDDPDAGPRPVPVLLRVRESSIIVPRA